MGFQQACHCQRSKRGDELIALFDGVTAILDGADDRGVSTRAADSLGFQGADQRRFGVPRGGLGFVAHRIELAAREGFILGEGGQGRFLIVQCCLGIVDPFNVGSEKAGKFDMTPGGPELGVIDSDRRRLKAELRLCHLCGDSPFPDHRVQLGLATGKALFLSGFHLAASRTDGFVSLLRILGFTGVLSHLGMEILATIAGFHALAGRGDGLVREVHAVGTHIGDVTVFVQPLGDLHRLSGGHIELAVGFLLQGAGGERGIGLAGLQPRFKLGHHIGFGFEVPGVLVEVLTAGDFFAVDSQQSRIERGSTGVHECGFEIPVGPLAKRQSFEFPLDQNADGD